VEQAAPAEGEVQRKTIELHGKRYVYRTAGTGSLVVLLHGIAASSVTWDKVIPRLAKHHKVIAPDLLGHGESDVSPDCSLGGYANLVRDLLAVLGEERGTIVGHSLGGGVAMQFAYQFPERCERIVLVSSGGLGREVHPILRAAALPGAELVLPWLSVVGDRSIRLLAKVAQRVGLRESADLAETWRSFVALESAAGRRTFLHTVRDIVDLGGQRVSALDRLYLTAELPMLIVWGENDPLIPASHGRHAHEVMAGSRLEIFAGVGHFPYIEDPERFAAVVIDFIRTTKPGTLDFARLRSSLQSGARTPRGPVSAPTRSRP
jgi:pimeloyl-ACP methyl ester carboxylesterase